MSVKRYGFPDCECDATDEFYMEDKGMHELLDGGFVKWEDYAHLKAEKDAETAATFEAIRALQKTRDENVSLQAEVERLKAVSTIDQRTIQGLQRTPERSELARMTAWGRELESDLCRANVKIGDLEAYIDSLKEKDPLKITELDVKENAMWTIACFRFHRRRDMKDIENLKKEVERLSKIDSYLSMCINDSQEQRLNELEVELEQRCRELNLSVGQQAVQLRQIGELKAEVERLKKLIPSEDDENRGCFNP